MDTNSQGKVRQMSKEESKKSQYYFSLQPSEMAVFRCAAEIFAAYVVSGKVTEDNRNEYYKKAITDAIQIGRIVEKNIESDDEVSSSGMKMDF